MLRSSTTLRFLNNIIPGGIAGSLGKVGETVKKTHQRINDMLSPSQSCPAGGGCQAPSGQGFISFGSPTGTGGSNSSLSQFMQMQQWQKEHGANGGRESNGGGSSGGRGPFGGGGGPFGGGKGPLGGMFDQMLEWCSKAHAQDIARRMNIDLKDIRFNFDSNGGCTVQVDAPNASAEQIRQLGEAVQQECPVARFRKTHLAGNDNNNNHMQWVPLPPPSPKP